ncbi:major facilitator superfamily domain-containing protein [Pseudomassariella vexata]|uniref:Major facilitator superfamily domain-containing protein n=1 Tax=Pseudomassariella vexata TaxID=1141098 RepID=A0A1Y2E089_9PEZI|nr:major facilitator superfamily domain-containing protein [Pseudomassariella vexata]ORY64907.1 major facilitator superfamily domain-containing protein [Pseudomassariella vexata]
MSTNSDIEAQVGGDQPADALARVSFDQDLHHSRRSSANHERASDSDKKSTRGSSEGEGAVEIESAQNEIARVESFRSRASRRSKKSRKDHLTAAPLPLSELEKGVVGWESQDDPIMPLNYATNRKRWIISLVAFVSLMTPLSSSILAPAIADISKEFSVTSTTLAAMPVSIYLLGYAFGPLFLAPLSEIHGRAVVLTTANIFFCLWHIGVALAPNLGSLVVFRFFSGVGGSGCMTLGGGIIADMFPVEERGLAMSLWTLGLTLGPSLGPVIGAFIAGSIGWRWAPWIVMIPSVICTILLFFLLPETNHRVLIDRKVKALRAELNRPELESRYETEQTRGLSRGAVLRIGLTRPLQILVFTPIVSILSIYVSFVYGTVYLMFNTISPVFENQYGWSPGVAGLPFIALALGFFAGLLAFSVLSDSTVIRLSKANGGVFKPEMRLPLMIYYAIITPITFFWYGWAIDKQVCWIVPVLGLFPLGVGVIGIWMPAQAYIVDAYSAYAASGLAAFTVLRSIIAAFLPLAGPAMFKSLGLGWGNSLLGFLCVAMIPVPVLIHRFGERIRKRYPLTF